MFEVVFLGTSASAPSAYRGLAAQVVFFKEHRFLVDCGEGTQRQILKSGIGFKRLNRILITHGHLDHILGLAGLLSTMIRWESVGETFEIYAGRPALDRIHDLLYSVVLRDETPSAAIKLIELSPGTFIDETDFSVSAFPVVHRGPGCFGFIFQEKTRRPFLVEQATALGVPFGPERARLVRGEAVTLSDGRLITPDEVLGADLPGARLALIGDVGRTDNLPPLIADSHALIIESTYLASEADMARRFGHMTAAGAAWLAREARVQTLLLTHLSRRSRERDVLSEARAIHPAAYVARDFDRYIIAKDKPVYKSTVPFDDPDDVVDDVDNTPTDQDMTAP
jgi:ribonuclease Z